MVSNVLSIPVTIDRDTGARDDAFETVQRRGRKHHRCCDHHHPDIECTVQTLTNGGGGFRLLIELECGCGWTYSLRSVTVFEIQVGAP